MKTKIQLMWETYKEQEEEFRKSLPEDYDEIELDELFKGIRGSEYRRGKEDCLNEQAKTSLKKGKEALNRLRSRK